MRLFLPPTSANIIAALGYTPANKAGDTFTGPVTITGAGLTPLTLTSTDAGAALGPIGDIYRNSASPAAADILGGFNFTGNSSTGVKRTLASLQTVLTTETNAAEVGSFNLWTMRAGTLTNTMFISNGAFLRMNGNGQIGWAAAGADPTGAQSAGFYNVSSSIITVDSSAAGNRGGHIQATTLGVGSGTAITAGGDATNFFRGTSTAGFGIYFGSGAPTISAAKGSIYLRSDGSGIADRLYVNTNGSTTWTNFVSAA